MKKIYSDFVLLSKRTRVFFILLFICSVFYKLFFLFYQSNISGPDAAEYVYLSKLFAESGIINYIKSNDPFSFWRLPTLPFILYITHSLTVFYIIQLLATYFLAYNFYQIIKEITHQNQLAFYCFFAVLFLPYINIAACAPLTEFMQVSFIIYCFRKVLYRQYDIFLISALVLFCFLRAEAQYFIYFLILRDVIKKQFNRLLIYTVPFLFIALWCVRNKINFDSFSLVNPVLSSRAMIGSLYGVIYEKADSDFHDRYNYYQARDYINNKAFVLKYKNAVKEEIKEKLLSDPIGYIRIRMKQFSKGFLYLMFNMEQLPDDDWKFKKHKNYKELITVNEKWAYSTIWKNKDYSKLFARLLYNGGFAFIHLFGFLFIFFQYKKLLPLLFILFNFCFVAIVEIDMRYLITIQSVCVCAFIILLYALIQHKTLKLDWIT